MFAGEVFGNDANAVLALLDEPNAELQQAALQWLVDSAENCWHEAAGWLDVIVRVAEESANAAVKKLAHLAAAKVYFALDSPGKALWNALDAYELFDPFENTVFARTMLEYALDKYVRHRSQEYDAENEGTADVGMANFCLLQSLNLSTSLSFTASSTASFRESAAAVQGFAVDQGAMHPRIRDLVHRVIEREIKGKRPKLAIGLAIEIRSLPLAQQAIAAAGKEGLDYTLSLVLDNTSALSPRFGGAHLTIPRKFKIEILVLLSKEYYKTSPCDYGALMQCLIALNQTNVVVEKLELLYLDDSTRNIALQIAFDLITSAPLKFRQKIIDNLSPDMEDLINILKGDLRLTANRDFLYSKNSNDLLLLANVRKNMESVETIKTALIISNGIMNAGTCCRRLMETHMKMYGDLESWDMFHSIASHGVIRSGSFGDTQTLFVKHVNRVDMTAAGPRLSNHINKPYCESGALFGTGLAVPGSGGLAASYLFNYLRAMDTYVSKFTHDKEIVTHGALLGLGLTLLGSEDEEKTEVFKDLLYSNNVEAKPEEGDTHNYGEPLVSEAAALAIGLTMVNTGASRKELAEELTNVVLTTTHERIARGAGMALALIYFGCQEEAKKTMATLGASRVTAARSAAMQIAGMAYCGTSDVSIIHQLLRSAASDVKDEVRCNALIALGFCMCKHPKHLPAMVAHMPHSHNPHVRMGVAFCLGIACAGTAMSEALDLLMPMLDDPQNFVVQAAYISTALVLMQASVKEEPRVTTFLEKMEKLCVDKFGSEGAKIGAVLAAGIINAGGNNTVINLVTPTGTLNLNAVVGMFVGMQYREWYPYFHFFAIALRPTSLVAVDKDLKVVKMDIRSNAPQSQFAVHPLTKPPEKSKAGKMKDTVLSYGKGKAQRLEREKLEKEQKARELAEDAKAAEDETMEGEKKEENKPEAEEEKFEILHTTCRITTRQMKHVRFDVDARYTPAFNSGFVSGVIVVDDNQPEGTDVMMEESAEAIPEGLRERPEGVREQAAVSVPESFAIGEIEETQ